MTVVNHLVLEEHHPQQRVRVVGDLKQSKLRLEGEQYRYILYSHTVSNLRDTSLMTSYSEEAGEVLEVADEVIDGAGDDVHGLELCGDDAQ